MERKFQQIVPVINGSGATKLYAVADDGTAWSGFVKEGHVNWTPLTPLPQGDVKGFFG